MSDKIDSRLAALEDIHNRARFLIASLPYAVSEYRKHRRHGELLATGTVEHSGGLRAEPSGEAEQAEAFRELMTLCRGKVDELTRLVVKYLPETAKRCPMLEFATAGGPDYTRNNFDVAEFKRQMREVEVDAGNAVLAHHPEPPPLGEIAASVYEILLELPKYRGLTCPKILDALQARRIYVDESSIRKNHLPELEAYGLEHAKRIGYRIKPSHRPA